MRHIILACALVGILGVPAFGQETVTPEGIYQLNLAKSTIRGPFALKSQTAYIGKETTVYVGFRTNDYDAYRGVFPAFTNVDGQPRQVDSILYDTQAAMQIDPYTFKVVRSKDGKVIENDIFLYNPDAKTITQTLISTSNSPVQYSYVFFFEKQ
jgi:hypothetical protein